MIIYCMNSLDSLPVRYAVTTYIISMFLGYISKFSYRGWTLNCGCSFEEHRYSYTLRSCWKFWIDQEQERRIRVRRRFHRKIGPVINYVNDDDPFGKWSKGMEDLAPWSSGDTQKAFNFKDFPEEVFFILSVELWKGKSMADSIGRWTSSYQHFALFRFLRKIKGTETPCAN